MDLADPNIPLSREADPAASVLGLAPFAILVLNVHVDRCRAAHGGLHVPVEGNGIDPVWFHLNLFISREASIAEQIGERESMGVLYILWVQFETRLYLGVCLFPPLLLT